MAVDDAGQAVGIERVRRGLHQRAAGVLGYCSKQRQPDAITEDGWFRTGDYVEISEGGYITG